MRTIVFQHGPGKGPGRLGATLRDHGYRLDIHRLDLPPEAGGKPVPSDLDNVQAVVVMGGDQNVGDPLPWMEAQRQFIRRAHEAELPVIGICLGAQQIAAALGGRVERMPEPEMGFHTVTLNHLGQTDTILRGIPWATPQLCTHHYQITALPKGAELLASSEKCKVAAFRVGLRTFGFQYHFEVDLPQMEGWAATYREAFERGGLSTQAFLEQAGRCYERYARAAERLSVNLATFCVPFERLTAV